MRGLHPPAGKPSLLLGLAHPRKSLSVGQERVIYLSKNSSVLLALLSPSKCGETCRGINEKPKHKNTDDEPVALSVTLCVPLKTTTELLVLASNVRCEGVGQPCAGLTPISTVPWHGHQHFHSPRHSTMTDKCTFRELQKGDPGLPPPLYCIYIYGPE